MGKRKHPMITFNEPSGSNRPTNDGRISKHFKGEVKCDDEDQQPCEIGYMQPEILPLEKMKTILVQKGALENLVNKENLKGIIQMFYKYVTPKPQREYRNSRREKLLSTLRKKKEKNGKQIESEWQIMDDTDCTSRLGGSDQTSRSEETENSSSNSEISRLKPPVASCVNLEKKKIKLSSSSTSSSLDTIKIKTTKKSCEGSNGSSELSTSSTSNTKSDINKGENTKILKREVMTDDLQESKKIKLQRNISISTISSKESKSPEEKKKKNPISWP